MCLFHVWLISLDIVFVKFTHVVVYMSSLFLFSTE